MTPELINSLVSFWKPIIALAVLLFVIFQRKPLQGFLERFVSARFKRGDTEFSLDAKENDFLPAYSATSTENEKTSDGDNPEGEQDKISSETQEDDWFENMIKAFDDGNLEAAKEALEIGQLAELDAHMKLRHQLFFHYLQFSKLNDPKAIEELEKLSLEDSEQSLAFYWLSICYQRIKSFDKAKYYLKSSIEKASSDNEHARRAKELIELILKVDSPDAITEALDIANKALKEIDKAFRSPVYQALADIYEKDNNNLLRAIALEKALETNTNDSDLFFSAAYAQAEVDKLSALALINYDTVLRIKPESPNAPNNMGVLADRFQMPIKSTELYRQSSEMKNTLSMANLAYKFLRQGFVNEADAIIAEAQQQENTHPNITEATSQIVKDKEAEKEKWNQLFKLGIKQKSFLTSFAEARFNSPEKPKTFNGNWKIQEISLVINESGEKFTTIWGEGISRRKLTGERKGEAAEVTLYKPSSWNKETFDSGLSGLCYLSSNHKRIFMMILNKEKPEFLEFQLEDS